mmetsp:Transcript_19123/g.44725  ORF Transcript_19123/g.44725 Transcript_19123/m.44725 type:complete len:210 (+) Transcript_19123:100-729(+)|eukprot:CAMPEP_0178424972 /NCGR_PEP_ID=MMETSP0689_2-20121128/28485_1 /TAXON_ID=160604 /ORGANISM="Amphidinium massartii, Strain CS-259" /LENGTH=209 /DNA_ID=CAMNT_0020046625 /DNA_START=40 /DNA_END=669 /DNA_ORIENTATION=-
MGAQCEGMKRLPSDKESLTVDVGGENTGVVHLNVYHLNDKWLKANHIFNAVSQVGGAFHTGVEIYGQEWTFGCDDGVCSMKPRQHTIHVYHQSIQIGVAKKSPEEVNKIIEEMKKEWKADDYHVLRKNCCNFSEAFLMKLLGEHLPAWVDRFGQMALGAAENLQGFVSVDRAISAIGVYAGPPRFDSIDTTVSDQGGRCCNILQASGPM